MDLYIISPPACFLVGLSTVQLRGSCAQTHVVAKSYVLGLTEAPCRYTNIPPSIYCDSDAFQFACVHLLLAGPKLLVSEGQVLTTSGILKGKVQARRTFRTLTLLKSICSGLNVFRKLQVSLLWYGVVTGSCLQTPIFSHAAALH